MVRAYIYLISFKNTNDIYIGKTILSIKQRFQQHKSAGTVCDYVKKNFNNDWSNVCIDVIDSIDMKEDLMHLLEHPQNTILDCTFNFRRYTKNYKTKEGLINHKLAYTEYFHIHNYKNDGKYNLINKKITNAYDAFEIYKFLNYTKTD